MQTERATGTAGAHPPLAGGVWQVLPTPFKGQAADVDAASLRRLVEHARGIGVAGVVALGVLGEAARLSAREKHKVLSTVVDAAGRMPVVAGVTSLATAPAIDEARRAGDVGAAAVMMLIPSPDTERVAAHIRAVSEACGLGVVIQDHPRSTGVVISPEALVTIADACGVAVAVKAECPPTPSTVAEVSGQTTLPVFGGLGGVGLLDELATGAAGAMTGFAFPEALVSAVTAYREAGFSAAKASLDRYLPVMVFEAQMPVSLALRKALLQRRGLIAEARVRSPGVMLPRWADALIAMHLDALGCQLTPGRHGAGTV